MELKNGRSSYDELREKYERTIIRHVRFDDGTARTTCILTTPENIFVGVSKFSNRTFNYSRKIGRTIAQGRAEHAHAVHCGNADRRKSQAKRREQLSYSVAVPQGSTPLDIVDEILSVYSNERE